MTFEQTILTKLQSAPGDVVSRRALEDALYTDRVPAGSNVLEVIVARLRKKVTGGKIVTAAPYSVATPSGTVTLRTCFSPPSSFSCWNVTPIITLPLLGWICSVSVMHISTSLAMARPSLSLPLSWPLSQSLTQAAAPAPDSCGDLALDSPGAVGGVSPIP